MLTKGSSECNSSGVQLKETGKHSTTVMPTPVTLHWCWSLRLSVSWAHISQQTRVVVRKPTFTLTHSSSVDLPGNQAQHVCQVKQTEKRSSTHPPPTLITLVTFHFVPATVLIAAACLIWTPTDCDWEKISTHWFCSAPMMEVCITQADWCLINSSFLWVYEAVET